MNVIIFILILLVLVLIHEFGHFWTAKKFGIRVDEFGFGFPPKLFGIKKGETEYTFNALPIGGFVKIFGENPDEDSINGPDAKRSFVNKPRWQQAIVLFAGVFANFLLAWVLFSFAFFSGMPTSVRSEMRDYIIGGTNLVVISVLPDSPAFSAGLQTGDKILAVSSEKEKLETITTETFSNFVSTHGGENLNITYANKNNEEKNIQIIPKIKEGENKGATAAPLAIGYLVALQLGGHGQFTNHGPGHLVLMILAGPVTAIPLLFFAAAAHRLPLVTLGLLMYLNPAMQMTWGVVVGHEPMPPGRWIGFALIWVALVVFTVDAVRRARADQPAGADG